LSVSGTLAVTGVATFTAQPILSSLTASQAVFTDSSKGLVSKAVTGTGDVVLAVSPALTGVPTAITAAAGTNTTQIATTAFVQTATGTLGTMSTQNANAVAITGGTITGTTVNGNTVGSNSVGARTVSTSAPSGGSNGDIWYQV